jgi:hypothetical protein
MLDATIKSVFIDKTSMRVVLIIVFFSSKLLAQTSCYDIDLRRDSMKGIKSCDQVLGTCYATSSSVALDSMFSVSKKVDLKQNLKVDPIYLSVLYTLRYEKTRSLFDEDSGLEQKDVRLSIEGGNSEELFRLANKDSSMPICLVEEKSIFNRLGSNDEQRLKRLQKLLEKYRELFSKHSMTILNYVQMSKSRAEIDNVYVAPPPRYRSLTGQVSLSDELPLIGEQEVENLGPMEKIRSEINREIRQLLYQETKYCMGDLVNRAFVDEDWLEVFTNVVSPLFFLKRLIESDCKKFVPAGKFKIKETNEPVSNTAVTYKFIKDNLKQGGSPVFVNYCYQYFKKAKNDYSKTFFYYAKDFESDSPGYENRCGRHSSMIIGSRMKNGKCQYLLRNSFNLPYANHIERDPKDFNDAWVDADYIIKNTYSASHVEPKE